MKDSRSKVFKRAVSFGLAASFLPVAMNVGGLNQVYGASETELQVIGESGNISPVTKLSEERKSEIVDVVKRSLVESVYDKESIELHTMDEYTFLMDMMKREYFDYADECYVQRDMYIERPFHNLTVFIKGDIKMYNVIFENYVGVCSGESLFLSDMCKGIDSKRGERIKELERKINELEEAIKESDAKIKEEQGLINVSIGASHASVIEADIESAMKGEEKTIEVKTADEFIYLIKKMNIKCIAVSEAYELAKESRVGLLKAMTNRRKIFSTLRISLGGDIDMNGRVCPTLELFAGEMDGKGYALKNVVFTREEGLCRNIVGFGKIKDINVVNAGYICEVDAKKLLESRLSEIKLEKSKLEQERFESERRIKEILEIMIPLRYRKRAIELDEVAKAKIVVDARQKDLQEAKEKLEEILKESKVNEIIRRGGPRNAIEEEDIRLDMRREMLAQADVGNAEKELQKAKGMLRSQIWYGNGIISKKELMKKAVVKKARFEMLKQVSERQGKEIGKIQWRTNDDYETASVVIVIENQDCVKESLIRSMTTGFLDRN